MSGDDDDWQERPRERRRDRYSGFTRDQHDRILKMLEDHERARWFWATMVAIAKWITSVAAAAAVLITLMKWGFGEVTKWRP